MIARSVLAVSTAMSIAACGSVSAEPAPIEVLVLRDGRLSVDGQVVTTAELRRRAPDSGVLLRAEPDIQYARFLEVMDDLAGLDIPIALVGQEAQ